MKHKILQKIDKWSTDEPDILLVGDRIDYLNDKLFGDYEPSIGPKPSFDQRLVDWLENVDSEEDQKILFRLIPKLFYIGKNEFDTLYRIAYNTNSIKWIVEINQLKFDAQLNDNIKKLIKTTWFCPITDSMRINQFYHLNGVDGADKRPEWRSLSAFGSKDRIQEFISENNFEQIVLLEDFVGSGNQIKESIEFAAQTFPDMKFLIVPILMCPHASEILDKLAKEFKNISIDPVIKLRTDAFLDEERDNNKDNYFKSVFDLAKSSHKKMKKAGSRWPFLGFRKIGAMIVLHTNTPNNSLPIIWSNKDWSPLFNRHVR